jgi:RNA polymerase primary sigma factor/RNA polymerase sigma factor
LKRQIFQQFCRGDSAEALAQRFCRSCTRIYGIIKEVRALRIMDLPLDSVGDEQFARLRSAKADREILPPPPESEPPAKKLRVPGGTPAYLASLYGVPLLTREQEAHLFWKMNYLKHKARGLRDELDVERPKSCLMRRIEKLYDESLAIKNRLIRSNLRLVVSIAKRYIGAATDFSDLVSDGNMSLIRAVQKFDVSQGNRFSTYASWAIMKNYARTVSDVLRQRSRFCTNHSAEFSFVEDDRTDPHEREAAQRERESLVGRILNRLDERERQIVTSRFGLIRGQEPLTLKEVGAVLGVSKERIRQIQGKALNKLRLAAGEENIE